MKNKLVTAETRVHLQSQQNVNFQSFDRKMGSVFDSVQMNPCFSLADKPIFYVSSMLCIDAYGPYLQ